MVTSNSWFFRCGLLRPERNRSINTIQSCKLVEDPDALLDLPKEQTTAITADRSAVELRPNLASL
jgi:hypothetical protein